MSTNVLNAVLIKYIIPTIDFMKKQIESFLPYIVVFLASLYKPYDADLGWHLKYGEYFFKNFQILTDNTFSAMMPDFKWANISWGVDLVYYSVFSSFGFLGLTLLGALIVTLTFFFFSKAFDLSYWEQSLIFPLLLIIEEPINQVSFRGQLLSLLIFGILIYLFKKYENKPRAIFLTIPLFFIWANLHGQFILGLGVFFIWAIIQIFNKYLDNPKNLTAVRESAKTLGLAFFLSSAVILIHPFGAAVYMDAFLHFENADLKSVLEYLPFDERSTQWWYQLIIGILVAVGVVFMYFEGKLKSNIPYLGLFGILYTLTFFVKRYAWSMYYLSIPFLQPVASFFKPNSKRNTFIVGTVLFIFYLQFAIYFKLPFTQYTNMSWDVYCKEYAHCSPASVEYLIKQKLDKNLFTLYNWGGYIIWNYPQIKPSIDGRMHLWRDKKGYSGFADYYGYEQNLKDIDDSSYNVVLMSPEKPVYKRLLKLAREGKWKLVYKDKYSGVFVRN